jgi:oligopeptide transport system permease protein
MSKEMIVTDEDFVLDVSSDITTDRNFASQSFWKGVFTRFKNNKRAMTGLVIIILIFILAVFGPMISGYGYKEIITNGQTQEVAKSLAPRIPALHRLFTGADYQDAFAGKVFLFGTDSLGRDLFTRVWYGARVSLMIAFVTILIDMLIGMSYGLISGYFGQVCDGIMQRFVEIANSIPRLVIVGVLATFMPKGVWLVIVALLLTEWIGMSKIARAEMLKIKGQEYIMASRTLGAKSFRIIFSDVLPNTIGPVITQVMFSIPTAIFTEAFLSFVGVGIVLPQCSIGSLIEDGFNNITTLPYQILPPIIVLALLMLAFNFVGDGLREALAPRIEDM